VQSQGIDSLEKLNTFLDYRIDSEDSLVKNFNAVEDFIRVCASIPMTGVSDGSSIFVGSPPVLAVGGSRAGGCDSRC
jgi:hypothetical protein